MSLIHLVIILDRDRRASLGHQLRDSHGSSHPADHQRRGHRGRGVVAAGSVLPGPGTIADSGPLT